MGRRYPAADIRYERIVRLAWRIYHGGEVASAWIRATFGVSKPTAKRDMILLERVLPVRCSCALKAGSDSSRARKVIAIPRVVRRLVDGEQGSDTVSIALSPRSLKEPS